MKKINTMKIEGKRWFQRSYGNTYHTVKVFVNGEALTSEITYGYGSHYLQTAAELLKENGYDIPEDNGKAYAYVIDFPHTVEDVKRKKRPLTAETPSSGSPPRDGLPVLMMADQKGKIYERLYKIYELGIVFDVRQKNPGR